MSSLGPAPLGIGEGCWLLEKLPGEVDEFWKRNLGDLTAKSISESTLVVLLARTWYPGEYAASEPFKLMRRLQHLISLACFGSVPKAQAGYYCLGHSGRLEQFQEWPRYVATPRVYFPTLRKEVFEFAARHVNLVGDVMRPHDDFYRVRMGLLAMDALMRADYAAQRLHLAIRSLDGLLATRQGRGERDFIHRGQYLIGKREEHRSLLKALYRLRGHVEHLKNPVDLVKREEPTTDDPVRESFRLSFQAELIASHAWHRFLDNEALLRCFENDDEIQAFWDGPNESLHKAWGDPLDIDSEVRRRFHGREEELHEVSDEFDDS